MKKIDVLCVGMATYDLIFSIDQLPKPDDKITASQFEATGGGPAANAAIAVSRLGLRSAFMGYLGKDHWGDKHLAELVEATVDTSLVKRGDCATSLSTILVQPDGKRIVVNHRGEGAELGSGDPDAISLIPSVILFDGHEPEASLQLLEYASENEIVTVLDAGSVNPGTSQLFEKVDFLVCSEQFAADICATNDKTAQHNFLAKRSKNVVITYGSSGLTWKTVDGEGSQKAFKVRAVDTCGAGDAFHGAFAAGLVKNVEWNELLHYASAAAALCCTVTGARTGLPSANDIEQFLISHKAKI